MTTLFNNADGGVDGVAVTTANSGGVSGNSWSAISKPSGTTVTFASAAQYAGPRGYRLAHPSGGSNGPWLRWPVTGWTQMRTRFYLRVSAYPSVTARIATLSDNTGKFKSVIVLTPTGQLGVQDGSLTTLFSSGPIGLGVWVRVEWIAAPGTTSGNGTLTFGWAVGDAAIAGGNTFTSAAANIGTQPLGNLTFGRLSGTWNATSDWDEVVADNVSSVAFVGPITVASPPPPVPVPDPTPSASPVPTVVLWPPDPYREAWRSGGLSLTYLVTATLNGEPIDGVTELRPIGGSITDTSKPGVRRVLNLELASEPGLFDRLSPIGTRLAVTCRVTYTDRSTFDIPMGVFGVDSEKVSEGGGRISLTAPDRWADIQRARFLSPKASIAGLLVTEQISLLIREVIGLSEPVTITATSTQTVGALTWEKDRDKAILDLAESIGAWVFFDRYGVATIADIPTAGGSADWLIDASPSGVLTELDRERSRTSTRNVVIVESSASDEAKFETQAVWDNDPTSPTYAGLNPYSPGNVPGPFGIVPHYYDTPVLTSDLAARTAGLAILARVTGLASQVSLGNVPNPAIDAFDVLDVLSPPERYDIQRVLERHVVDTVTHPLAVDGQAQHIDGRSTRTDDFS